MLNEIITLGPNAKSILPDLIEMIEESRVQEVLWPMRWPTLVDAFTAVIEKYKKSDMLQKQQILIIFSQMREMAKPALPFLSQEYIAATDQSLSGRIYSAVRSIIRDTDALNRFIIELNEKLNKSRQDKKKSAGPGLDGVGYPIKPLQLRRRIRYRYGSYENKCLFFERRT